MKTDIAQPASHPVMAPGALNEFLKMFAVATLGGLFFSLVAGLVVFLVAAGDAFAHPLPPQKGQPAQQHPGFQRVR